MFETIYFPQDSRFIASPEAFYSDISEETVLLNLTSGKYFGLDEIGTIIWVLLQQSKSVGEIKTTLTAKYDVSLEECDRDLQELLLELLEANLIEQVEN